MRFVMRSSLRRDSLQSRDSLWWTDSLRWDSFWRESNGEVMMKSLVIRKFVMVRIVMMKLPYRSCCLLAIFQYLPISISRNPSSSTDWWCSDYLHLVKSLDILRLRSTQLKRVRENSKSSSTEHSLENIPWKASGERFWGEMLDKRFRGTILPEYSELVRCGEHSGECF